MESYYAVIIKNEDTLTYQHGNVFKINPYMEKVLCRILCKYVMVCEKKRGNICVNTCLNMCLKNMEKQLMLGVHREETGCLGTDLENVHCILLHLL